MDIQARRHLRAAVHWRDTADIIEALTPAFVSEAPQLAGEALLLALEHRDAAQASSNASALAQFAEQCIVAAGGRGWDGDSELVDELRRALGHPHPHPDAAETDLAPVPVDLDAVVELLRGGEHHVGGYLNLHTGETLPDFSDLDLSDVLEASDTTAPEDLNDTTQWLHIQARTPSAGYRDMAEFIDHHAPPHAATPLREAITGKGAFRRFREQLAHLPELEDRWHTYSEDRWVGRGRAHLANAGFRPTGSARPHTP